ncbi:transcriptional regulator, BadM/Rrf2 family [Pasteurella testudinis DSM 23072]|uniref:Transcriptional regulator, BadM/Rrf2 family n=1 Tax=Pasteurella testudinis DSM 23072 TaxID=1122938 RepID=A0A1W1UUK1_9PAST|nr:Rrf2 family transcriptional regulator [Pasteurella testudinis]SMB84815.1 transcriptional regulator, BadM/Rrf2 family [Pasteurella testudinis DSM 23072]SUB51258.1 iron-sulfur cluster assembly transcription factor IscR [Pasteurella testudinis]
MKLSKFTDYNLRVLIYLALHTDRLCTIQEIATAYQISENHLMKVIHHLAKQQTILSRRGKGGGIQLARPVNEINLSEVIRNAEGDDSLVRCRDHGVVCCIAPVCRLPSLFEQALDAFYQHLAQYSLSDVLKHPDLLAHHFTLPEIKQSTALN